MDWKKLQNGSDIRGIAMEGVSGENVNLTPGVVNTLGKSFVEWLRKQGYSEIRVSVGIDSRITGPVLRDAFMEGVTSMGAEAVDCPISSSPLPGLDTPYARA
ncbi:MAG: hypothetical protein IH594_00515 [Bacteroidales bacterium]|nr:hypothetical protein [Bacteroidales bacterium]